MSKIVPYTIVYEDNDIIVVNKSRDVLTIRTDDKKTFHYNLYYYLKMYLNKNNQELHIVHRLDYETSGLLVFAKNKEVKIKLQNAFKNHDVIRLYEAVIKERIDLDKEFIVDQKLLDKEDKVIISDEGKEAITKIKSVNYINIGTALEVNILTGRRNQIRIAIASLGYTLLGDKRYSNDINKRLYLNAYYLKLPDNIGLKKNEFKINPLWITKTTY